MRQAADQRLMDLVVEWERRGLHDSAKLGRVLEDFNVLYGNWAYLCGEQFHLGGLETTDYLAAIVGLTAEDHLLDVACYLGGPARYLATHYGCRVTGLDIHPAVIRGAQWITRVMGLGHRVEFVQGDAFDMPFNSDGFDVVWGQDSWPHAPGLFEECSRVLKPEGRLVFTNSVRSEQYDVIRGVDDEFTYEAYTLIEYQRMMRQAGFLVTLAEDITPLMLRHWLFLRQKLRDESDYWESKLGAERFSQEAEALDIIIHDYQAGRIAHGRFVAVKAGEPHGKDDQSQSYL